MNALVGYLHRELLRWNRHMRARLRSGPESGKSRKSKGMTHHVRQLRRVVPLHRQLCPEHPCRGSNQSLGPRSPPRFQRGQLPKRAGSPDGAGPSAVGPSANRWPALEKLERICRTRRASHGFRIHGLRPGRQRRFARYGGASPSWRIRARPIRRRSAKGRTTRETGGISRCLPAARCGGSSCSSRCRSTSSTN